MSSYLSAFVRSSRLVGIAGTGLLAGHNLAISYSVIPALIDSGITADRLVLTWEKMLHRMHKLIVPAVLGSVAALLEGAYRAHVHDTPAATTFLGFTASKQLVIAAITTFAVVPYSIIWVSPVMNRLSVIARNVEEMELMNETPYISEELVHKDVQTWSKQTAFRGILFGTAFVLSLTAVYLEYQEKWDQNAVRRPGRERKWTPHLIPGSRGGLQTTPPMTHSIGSFVDYKRRPRSRPHTDSHKMSSRSSFLTSFVNSARLVGVVGTGLLAGYDIGLSHSVIPALVNSSLPGDRLVAAWNQIFNNAAGFVIPVIVGSTIAFLEAAYKASIRTTQVKTVFGLTNGRQLVIAAFATFAVLPYSALSVTPVIYRLKGANRDIEESRSKGGITFVDEASVKEDIEAWGKKNAVRAALFTASFVLGLTAV